MGGDRPAEHWRGRLDVPRDPPPRSRRPIVRLCLIAVLTGVAALLLLRVVALVSGERDVLSWGALAAGGVGLTVGIGFASPLPTSYDFIVGQTYYLNYPDPLHAVALTAVCFGAPSLVWVVVDLVRAL